MTAIAQRESPQLGIFWVAQTTDSKARPLAAGPQVARWTKPSRMAIV